MRALILFPLIVSLAAKAAYPQELRLSTPISDFTLQDMNGSPVSYSTLKGNVTVVIFFSTRCPMSNAFNYRRNTLYNDFAKRASFIIVDSNFNESIDEVREYARAVEFDSPVYKDLNNVLADQLGANVTTDTFVLDSSGVIRYHGYLEDSPNPTRAKKQGLRLAIEAVLEGKPVAMPVARSLGCSIRRTEPRQPGAQQTLSEDIKE